MAGKEESIIFKHSCAFGRRNVKKQSTKSTVFVLSAACFSLLNLIVYRPSFFVCCMLFFIKLVRKSTVSILSAACFSLLNLFVKRLSFFCLLFCL